MRTLKPPATNKVHQLEPVTFGECGRAPSPTGNNIPVLFNGKPVRFEFKHGDQIENLGPICELRKFTRLPIHNEMHESRLSPRRHAIEKPIRSETTAERGGTAVALQCKKNKSPG
jgi:hypothetical protein